MIRIEYDDAGGVRKLTILEQATRNLSPVMADIALYVLGVSEDAFVSESDPVTGSAWPSLQQSTIAGRIASGHWPGKMLQRSGHLIGSLQPDHGHNFASVSTNAVHASTHQHGRGSIPQRRFLGLSESDERTIADMIASHITRRAA